MKEDKPAPQWDDIEDLLEGLDLEDQFSLLLAMRDEEEDERGEMRDERD